MAAVDVLTERQAFTWSPVATKTGVAPVLAQCRDAVLAPPLPVTTELYDCTSVQPVLRPTPLPLAEQAITKPRVLITTVRIDDGALFSNGLHQNVFILYRLFETIGYEPYLVVDNNGKHPDATLYRSHRTLDVQMYASRPFPIVAYVEVGMSCDPTIRRFFRALGAKAIKCYLGSILNIDIETPIFYPALNFSHHVAGELDVICTSPHYMTNAEYAGAINGLRTKVAVAPYVWDPQFISAVGETYTPPSSPNAPRVFLVMEPNISHQKASVVPLAILEAYYRKHPDGVDAVIVVNGAKLAAVPYCTSSFLPCLTLARDGRLAMLPRANVLDIARRLPPGACVVQAQCSNIYNYAFLDWMTLGHPVIHNASLLEDYAYYYPDNDIDAGVAAIERAVAVHDLSREGYRSQIAQLTWNFSVHNPTNQNGWRELLAPLAGQPTPITLGGTATSLPLALRAVPRETVAAGADAAKVADTASTMAAVVTTTAT